MNEILLGKGEQPVHLLAKYGNRHGLVAGATVESFELTYLSTKASLSAAKASVSQAYANLAQAKANLGYATIRAPVCVSKRTEVRTPEAVRSTVPASA